MKVALAHAIGPIANIVMKEKVGEWVAVGAPSKTRFRELAKMLATEIGDQGQQSKFFSEIKHLTG